MSSDFLQRIIAPQLKFEGINQLEKFERLFCDLYRITIFKDGLDLILTKLQEKDLSFEVSLIKDWDTNLGCYLTEQNSTFNSVVGKFLRQVKKKIIIKNFKNSVMAHEMAHAIEFESEINLGEEFVKCLSVDLGVNNILLLLKAKYAGEKKSEYSANHAEISVRKTNSLALDSQIKRLMFDALKSYPEKHFLSELFARFFELISLSRDIQGLGDFNSKQVTDFFANTSKFITDIFNPRIKNKIDLAIANHTKLLVVNLKDNEPERKFADNVNSFYKIADSDGKKSFAKNVKSNASYQASWQKYQELEDKNN